jgi:hypothetical protein
MTKSGLVAGMFAPAIIFPVIKSPAVADSKRSPGSRSAPPSAVAAAEQPSAPIAANDAKRA